MVTPENEEPPTYKVERTKAGFAYNAKHDALSARWAHPCPCTACSAAKFWRCKCVCGLTSKAFIACYRKWRKRKGYYFGQDKAEYIYAAACGHATVMPQNEITKLLLTQAVTQLNAIAETLAIVSREMTRLAERLPEHPVVSEFYGAGDILGPQLMAEIGDITRFAHKGSLACFAGLEPPKYQSGKFQAKNRNISKTGSSHLRRTLFLVMDYYLKMSPAEEPAWQFLDRRKRAEGSNYFYMTAGAAKFYVSTTPV